MPRATLLVAIEGGADSQRAFGNIVNQSRRANAAMSADSRRAASQEERQATRLAAMRTSAERRVNSEFTRMSRERAQSALRDSSARIRDAQREMSAAKSLYDMKLIRARAWESERNRLAGMETQSYQRQAAAMVRASEQAERAVTRNVIREQRERTRRMQAIGGVAQAVGGYAMGVGQSALTMSADVRQRRAATGQTLNEALYQAGAGQADAVPLRNRVYEFARQNGMRSEDLAQGINAVQTEFSTLGNSRSTAGERSQNMERLLQTALFARNTGQNVSEVMRVSGMLQNAGITGEQNHTVLQGLTGMAQRGAVELGDVTRTAMAPMMARMHDARSRLLQHNPNATAGDIAQAQSDAAQAAFAEIEVARGQGAAPRRFANVMASLGTELQGQHRQDLIRTNIENAQGISDAQKTQLRAMFNGTALREQYTTGVGFAAHVNEVLGGNEAQMRNIFAGSGHGNAQSLQTNWRNAIAQMMGGGADVQAMLHGIGRDFGAGDEARGAGLFGTSDVARLNTEAETHDAEIANTTALTQLTSELSAFRAAHPIESAAIAALPGGAAIEALAAHTASPYSNETQASAAINVARRHGGVDTHDRRDEIAMEMERLTSGANRTASKVNDPQKDARLIGQAVATALRESPLTATIDPHTAAHAAAGAASGPVPPPPEGRPH